MLTSSIFNMFGRSPIRPLQVHMEKSYSCVKILLPFFNAVLAKDSSQVSDIRDQIALLEKEADEMKKDLRLHLPKGLFLPVPRTDILELLTVQDRIANKAKDIAGLVFGRELVFPEEIAEPYLKFLQRCIDAASQANKAIHELDELLEAGFRGNEVKLVEEMIVELDLIEHDTDEMQIEVRRKLYAIEDSLSPIDAVFLYKAIDWTGDLADRSQTIGGRLLLLLAR